MISVCGRVPTATGCEFTSENASPDKCPDGPSFGAMLAVQTLATSSEPEGKERIGAPERTRTFTPCEHMHLKHACLPVPTPARRSHYTGTSVAARRSIESTRTITTVVLSLPPPCKAAPTSAQAASGGARHWSVSRMVSSAT